MPILEPRKHRPPELHAVREVRLGMPFERRGEVIRFYTEVLGLRPWPASRQICGCWGAGDPNRGLLFAFRHEPLPRSLLRRFTLRVDSLAETAERLAELDLRHERRRGLGPCDDAIYINDPAGHVVELREIRWL